MIETRPGTRQLHRPATAVEKRQRKALEGRLRNEYHHGISPVKERMTRIEQELAATRERIQEIEGMMADPTHYENPQNIVAVNREYMALRENVARLTTEWENLAAEADRIDLEYRRAQEDLPG